MSLLEPLELPADQYQMEWEARLDQLQSLIEENRDKQGTLDIQTVRLHQYLNEAQKDRTISQRRRLMGLLIAICLFVLIGLYQATWLREILLMAGIYCLFLLIWYPKKRLKVLG